MSMGSVSFNNNFQAALDLKAAITDVNVANSAYVKTALNATGSAPIYAARAWVDYNQVTNTPLAGGNVLTVTDHSAGAFTANFTTNMPDANYSAFNNSTNSTASDYARYWGIYTAAEGSRSATKTVSGCRFWRGYAVDSGAFSGIDAAENSVVIFR